MINIKKTITCDRCGNFIKVPENNGGIEYKQMRIHFIDDNNTFFAKLGDFCPDCLNKIIKFCNNKEGKNGYKNNNET